MRLARFYFRILVLFIAGGAGLTVYYFYSPAMAIFSPPCLLYKLTGLYCPGCGSARAFHQLAQNHYYAAFRYNPLLVSFLPVLAYMIFTSYFPRMSGVKLPRIFNRASHTRWLLIVLISYAVMRNIPYYPFSLLAPTPVLP